MAVKQLAFQEDARNRDFNTVPMSPQTALRIGWTSIDPADSGTAS